MSYLRCGDDKSFWLRLCPWAATTLCAPTTPLKLLLPVLALALSTGSWVNASPQRLRLRQLLGAASEVPVPGFLSSANDTKQPGNAQLALESAMAIQD